MEKIKYMIPVYGWFQLFDQGIQPGELNSLLAYIFIVWHILGAMGLLLAIVYSI